MEEFTLSEWKELADLAYQHRNGGWMFRGVGDPKHDLTPKAFRGSLFAKGYSYSLENERAILDRFIRMARPLVQDLPKTKLEWMVIAQHHGVPTRLLDWTANPLVAAYFAVKSGRTSQQETDRVIFGAQIPEEPSSNQSEAPFDKRWARKKPVSIRPPHISPRVPIQQSILTLHHDSQVPWDPPELRRWVIPKKKTFVFKKALDALGINEASLFPDLDGIARHLEWLYRRARS